MGRALAEAFLAAGHPTTVWNRTPHRAAPLVTAGADHRPALADALAASSVIISCTSTFRSAREILTGAEPQLAGRTVITLNSGTPTEAREFAAWVRASICPGTLPCTNCCTERWLEGGASRASPP
ncbi:NAD(P)-binding domain-containing protein [Nocardia sp. NPDC051750]|uniref:NAD(P)-binding domain-containing protein n=1 Tax=Nocardia sp. NPDC051750 TaxID=3364325 RepID=UPI0037A9167D